MEQLKYIKEILTGQVQSQLGNLQSVDTKELGEVIDMIKDMEEAIYYCTITKAMEAKDKEGAHSSHYYTEYNYPTPHYRDMDRYSGRMYYEDNGTSSNAMRGDHGPKYYTEWEYPMVRDRREGKSGVSRRTYMEHKEMHVDKSAQLKELEKYMQDLTKDLTEMIEDASPEEKQLLQQRISTLASKIQ